MLRNLLYASTILSAAPVYGAVSLEEALLTDILGEVLLYKDPSQDVCDPSTVTGTTEISQSLDNVYFDPAYADVETDMFQTQIKHIPGDGESADNAWTIRVATGGNIYSYQSSLGELMPPNIKAGMYMVDEVWQSVAVNTTLNDFPDAPWFIHQAGVYQKEENTATKPYWMSPSIAHWCSTDLRECRFAGWGQQAHVPTKYHATAIYYNRFRDCGNGIMQFTSLVHNFSTETRFNYMSLPWFGVRNTLYKDVMIKRDPRENSDEKWITHYPNQFFGVSPRWLLPMTGGYTMFAESRQGRPEFEFPGNPYFETAAQDKIPIWTIGDNIYGHPSPCLPSKIHSMRYNSYHIYCRLATGTPTWPGGCKACNLVFENVATGVQVPIVNVAHYADPKDDTSQGAHIYFGPEAGDTYLGKKFPEEQYDEAFAQTVNDAFLAAIGQGDTFVIKWGEGKPDPENVALAYVHGINTEITEGIGGAQYWLGFARIEYGDSWSFLRRFMVFNEVQLIKMDPGVTFGKNAFVITGKGVDEVGAKAESVLESTIEDYNLSGDLPYRRLDLIVKGDEFGIAIDGEACAGPFTCTGYTTPQVDVSLGRTKPYFYITWCSQKYFGPDIEKFAQTDNYGVLRVYDFCTNPDASKERPKIKLMGFFPVDLCTEMEGKSYNSDFCPQNQPSVDEFAFADVEEESTVNDFCGV